MNDHVLTAIALLLALFSLLGWHCHTRLLRSALAEANTALDEANTALDILIDAPAPILIDSETTSMQTGSLPSTGTANDARA